jgi:radical SAM protein with 4Fe4S-binding SPASM domain
MPTETLTEPAYPDGQPIPGTPPGARLRITPESRLLPIGGTHLLINPQSGSWLRLSDRAVRLVRALAGEPGREPTREPALETLAAGESVDEFLHTLRSGGFLRPEGAPSAVPEPSPFHSVLFNVTHRCNLACAHCAVYSQLGGGKPSTHLAVASRAGVGGRPLRPPAREPEQPTERVLDLIRRIADRGARQVVFFGGEPLVRRDFHQVLRSAARRIPRLAISTNGTLLDEATCRLLIEHDVEVRVSLDGSRPEVNDPIRGAGSFRRALEGVRRLRRLGHPRISIKAVITRGNVEDLPHLVKLARRLGVVLQLSPFVVMGRGRLTRDDHQVAAGDLLRMYRRVWLLAEYYGVPSVSFNAFCHRFLGRPATSCGAGLGYVLVDCTGTVYPCEGLQHWPLRLGSLDGETAGDAAPLRPLAAVEDLSVEAAAGCRGCPVRYFCKGGCYAEAYTSERRRRASSLCGFYRRVLPPVAARFDPRRGSWHNLREVFGGDLDFEIVKGYVTAA